MILTMTGGGAEQQLAHIAPELSRRGHDVHVAYVVPGVHSERLAAEDCTLHHLAASLRWKALLPLQAVSVARRLRPDVLHTWLAHMDLAGGAAARMLRIPWVMSERSAALSYAHGMVNGVRAVVCRRADRIVANSQGGVEYWMEKGVDAARMEVIPNFVPVADIEAAPPLEDARVSDDDELIVHVGRLSGEKNLPLVVDALRDVVRARPHARLAFCGEGLLENELRAQVDALGLSERVIFAGFVSNVSSWLKRSRVLLAVSRCEGHPNAVLEAIAAGVPVVLSDIPAYRSIVGDDAALFAAEGDAPAIAAGVVRTLEDRAAAEGRAARARCALASQSLQATAARYEDAYRRAIETA